MKIKQYEKLEFTDDFMFSYAMGNNEELCRELLAEGREEGERLFACLTEILLQEGKTAELKRAAEDKTYRNTLYCQYGILK